jgi:hypothetical protein
MISRLPLAAPAGVLRANEALHTHPLGDDVELLADDLTDALLGTAARTDFAFLGDINDDLLARQVRGDGLAATLLAGVCRNLDDFGLFCRGGLFNDCLGLVEKGILHLVPGRLFPHLGTLGKTKRLQQPDLLGQFFDESVLVGQLPIALGNIGRKCGNELLESERIIWQASGVHNLQTLPNFRQKVN